MKVVLSRTEGAILSDLDEAVVENKINVPGDSDSGTAVEPRNAAEVMGTRAQRSSPVT